jgi:hypothetical protein
MRLAFARVCFCAGRTRRLSVNILAPPPFLSSSLSSASYFAALRIRLRNGVATFDAEENSCSGFPHLRVSTE